MKKDPKEHSEDIIDLFDKLFEQRLSEAESGQLEELLSSDAEARRIYLEHATLYWESVTPDEGLNRGLVQTAGQPAVAPAGKIHWLKPLLAAAACVALLLAGIFADRAFFSTTGAELIGRGAAAGGAAIHARLTATKGCTWGPSSLPTAI